ncbi:MAG: hypothetical protein GWP19_05950 [Planctomycetia bacterium]|nr:hypothetical protein [Planctomycetia bacterium]
MINKNLINKITNNWHKVYFLISVFFLIFIYGTLVGRYQLFPFKIIHNAKLAAEDWLKDDNYKQYANIRPEQFIHPARDSGNGVTINLTDKTYNGYTLITSMWDDVNGFKLIDMEGVEIHNWRVSYNSVFPVPDSTERQITDWDVDIQGSVIYPNGDIVFNFNGKGLVKIDKNSDVIWKLKGDYHHSIFKDESGDLWIPGRETLNDTVDKFLLLYPPYYEDYICKISPTGKILEKFSLLEVFYNSGMESILFADGTYATQRKANDITHLNDIDILSSKLANHYPQFKAGDIMVSMRHLNLIMILDSDTRKIKWANTGPYISQHDPDFTPNGDIVVMDNRADDSDGEILGGSRILKIDPLTRNINILYQSSVENKFYSNIAGKQQLLPNGNILIAEYDAGRVFEVTNNSEIVWTFINGYDDDEVYAITDAIRISKSYLTFLR